MPQLSPCLALCHAVHLTETLHHNKAPKMRIALKGRTTYAAEANLTTAAGSILSYTSGGLFAAKSAR